MKNTLIKDRIRNHFAYQWWFYLLALTASVLVVNLLYVQTAYHPPENKRIDVVMQGAGFDNTQLDAYLAPIWHKSVPDMETVESIVVMPAVQENVYGTMQLTAYFAAGQGDLYILDIGTYKNFAAQGAFIPLNEQEIANALPFLQNSLPLGKVSVPKENGGGYALNLFGLPLRGAAQLENALGIKADNLIIAMAYQNGNEDSVRQFLLDLMRTAFSQEGSNP